MYLFFFILWLIFNGRVTVETVLLGLAVSAAVFAFVCRFMGYSIAQEKKLLKLIPLLAAYFFVLIAEIVKSASAASAFIIVPSRKTSPLIYKFRTDLKSRTARAVLANSITLTPGTITVSLDDDVYTVHCLDRSMAEGLENSSFARLLRRMEEVAL